MKIAYTMNGLIGGLSGKNSSGSARDDQIIVLKYVSEILQKYIMPWNDVDFFIFSWILWMSSIDIYHQSNVN